MLNVNRMQASFATVLRFWYPFGDLGATYDDHLRLIGKRVVDFLLVLIELFLLGVTAEVLWANIGWKSAIWYLISRKQDSLTPLKCKMSLFFNNMSSTGAKQPKHFSDVVFWNRTTPAWHLQWHMDSPNTERLQWQSASKSIERHLYKKNTGKLHTLNCFWL